MYLAVYDDGTDNATGTPRTVCMNSGMYVSSVSYSYSIDGSATESVTMVGNDRFWNSDFAALGVESGGSTGERWLPVGYRLQLTRPSPVLFVVWMLMLLAQPFRQKLNRRGATTQLVWAVASTCRALVLAPTLVRKTFRNWVDLVRITDTPPSRLKLPVNLKL